VIVPKNEFIVKVDSPMTLPRSSDSSTKRTILVISAGIGLLIGLAACQTLNLPGTAPRLSSPAVPQKTSTVSATPGPNTTAAVSGPIYTGTAQQTPAPPGDNSTATDSATLTAWPTKQFTPSLGPSPTHTATATFTPTITSTPTPPLASLRLIRPGPFSKISSPIKVEAMVIPGDDGFVYFDLLGEDGRIINHVEDNLKYNLGQHIIIVPKIDFQTSAVAESARLVMYTRDLSGRMISLTSVDLFLLSLGSSVVTAPNLQQEPFLVRWPRYGDSISGGTVHLIGLVKPLSNKPLVVELIDDQQNVVGSANLQIPPPPSNLSHSPFEVDIPYSIKEEKKVRLSMRQESDTRIPGDVGLYSLMLDLQP
jgi:hypothetical protein